MLNFGGMQDDFIIRHADGEQQEPESNNGKPTEPSGKFERSRSERRFNPWSLVVYAGILAAFAVAGTYIGQMVAHMPILDIEEAVSNYQQNVNTLILDGSGETKLTELAEERRVLVSYDQIPQNFINALIIAEDKDFLHHQGVDLFGVARAFWTNLTHGRVVQGGSTISQQLIKNLFLSPEQTYTRKIKEAVLALQLEAKYTKEEIIGFYCNTIYFGHQRYGLEAAARYYFGVSASELNLPQCALLAGLIRAPERYTPYRHPQRAKQRRDFILNKMALNGEIGAEEAKAAKETPIILRDRSGKRMPAPYFVEEVRKFLISRFGRQQAYGGGLRVYTTLDQRMQAAAEKAVRTGLYELSMRQPLRTERFNVIDNGDTLESYSSSDWNNPLVENEFVHALVAEVGKKKAKLRIGEQEITIGASAFPTKLATREQRSDLTKALRAGDVLPVQIVKLKQPAEEGAPPLIAQVKLSQEPSARPARADRQAETARRGRRSTPDRAG